MTQHEVIKRFIEFSERGGSFRTKESVLSYHYEEHWRKKWSNGALVVSDTNSSAVLATICNPAGRYIYPKGGEITVNMTDYGTTFTSDFAKIRNVLIREIDLKSIPYRKADNVPQWKTSSIMRIIKRDYPYTKDYTKDHIIYFGEDNVYTKADKLPEWSDISLYDYIVKRMPNNQAELTFTEPTDIVIFGSEIFITPIDWVPSNWGRNMPFPHITEDTNTLGYLVDADVIDLGTGEVIGQLFTGTNMFSVATLSDIKRAYPDASQKKLTCCAIIRGFTGTVRTTRKNVDGELIIIGNGNINFKTEITRSYLV